MAGLRIRLRIKVTPGLFRGLLAASLLSGLAQELASETVTLSTYFPAPSGVYTKLIATGNAYLSRDNTTAATTQIGSGTSNPNAHRLSVVDASAITIGNIAEFKNNAGARGVSLGFTDNASGSYLANSTYMNAMGSFGSTSMYLDAQNNGSIVLGSLNSNENIAFGHNSPPPGTSGRWFGIENLNDGRNTFDGITWYNPAPTNYGIYRTGNTYPGCAAGAWCAGTLNNNGAVGAYQQLEAQWSTGIIIDGGSAYALSGTNIQPNGGHTSVGVPVGVLPSGLLQVGGPTGSVGVLGSYHPCTNPGTVNASCGANTYATTMSGFVAKYVALESPILQSPGSAPATVQPSFFCCPCPATGCPAF